MKKLDLNNSAQMEKAFAVMRQLRTHLTLETFMNTVEKLSVEAYEMWALEENGKYIGLMGMRPYTDFVRETHYFIDDLVVDESVRSQGHGAKMLKFAEDYYKKCEVGSLRLCCAHENKKGHAFYTREGWTDRGCVFVKK